MEKAKKALEWISKLFSENEVSYLIVGGLAANAYGSPRGLVDIDIWTCGEDFGKACELVKDYVVIGPTFYRSMKWDAEFVNINYSGQEIDVGNGDNTKIFDEQKGKWHKISLDYTQPTVKELLGVRVPVIPREKLIEYKRILGRIVDGIDIDRIQGKQN